jgi:hypothetical protein
MVRFTPLGLRDCFLTQHKGHEGLTFEGQNSGKSVKFVAQHRLLLPVEGG